MAALSALAPQLPEMPEADELAAFFIPESKPQ